MVVKLEIVEQGGLQIRPAIEAGLRDQFTDPAIEALHHTVGLRMARRRPAVLDLHASAGFVEGVVVAGLLVFGSRTIGKLRAVVGQDFGDLDRRRELQTAQEINAATFSHVAVDMQANPPRGAIDSHEQIAP